MLVYSIFMEGKTQNSISFHQTQRDLKKKKNSSVILHGFNKGILKFTWRYKWQEPHAWEEDG